MVLILQPACGSELPYFIGNLVHIFLVSSSLTSDSSHGAHGYIKEALTVFTDSASRDDTPFEESLHRPASQSLIVPKKQGEAVVSPLNCEELFNLL